VGGASVVSAAVGEGGIGLGSVCAKAGAATRAADNTKTAKRMDHPC
jgi:hypothetical protein